MSRTSKENSEECFDVVKSSQQGEVTCHIIGDIGKWQFILSILMSLLKFSVPWIQLGIIFLAYPKKFQCTQGDSDWKNHTIYNNTCEISTKNLNISRGKECEYFEFDLSTYKSTIVSEWNLVCSNAQLVEVSQACVLFAVLLGNLIFGILSDKYGRRNTLLICVIIQTLSGFASVVTPWFAGFILSRFMMALASGGITTITFVLCLETVGGKWRNIIPILYHVPFGLGGAALATSAYILRNWRHIQLVLSVISLSYLLFFLFILESPKWLLATGQYEKAIDTLKKICMFNKRNIANVERQVKSFIESTTQNTNKRKINNISKKLKVISLILWIECFLSGISFFAFIQRVGVAEQNIFLSVALNGLAVAPGTIITLIFLKKFNYKVTIIVSQMWTALCFILMIIFVNGNDWLQITFAMMGIIGISVSAPVLTIYMGVIYPTEIRNAGVGIAVMFNRLGSVISTFVIYLETLSPTAPHFLLCGLTVLQAILLCFMPNIDQFSPTISTVTNTKNSQKQTKLLMEYNNNPIN